MPDSTWEIVAATGHRPRHLSLLQRRWVRAQLPAVAVRLRDEFGTRTAVSGFAAGTDLWWADAAKCHAGLFLWAHIPFPQQPDVWTDPRDRDEWRRLRALADDEVIYGDHYDNDFYGERNIGMLHVSGAVVAVHKPSKRSGGTWGALKEARRRRMPIVHLDPKREVVDWPEPPNWRARAVQLPLFGEAS